MFYADIPYHHLQASSKMSLLMLRRLSYTQKKLFPLAFILWQSLQKNHDKKKKKNLGESSADFCTWTTEENLVESLVRARRAYCFVTTEISGLNNGTPNQWGFSLKTLTLNWGCASPLGWDVRCHFKNSIIQRFTQKAPIKKTLFNF